MIQGINNIDVLAGNSLTGVKQQVLPEDGKSFSEILKDAMGKLNQMGEGSRSLQTAFTQGENVELHDVVIAMEEASIAMDLLISVRNKVVEAYQEIMRMPV